MEENSGVTSENSAKEVIPAETQITDEHLDGDNSAENENSRETDKENPEIVIFQEINIIPSVEDNFLNAAPEISDTLSNEIDEKHEKSEDVICNGTPATDVNKLTVDHYSFDDTSESTQPDDPDKLSMSEGLLVNDIDSRYLEEQANLKRMLTELNSKCTQLDLTVREKNDTISLLEKERNVLEKEKLMIKREVELSRKEKESAVMRYATVEKGLLDAKNSKDNAERKMKDMGKEMELLSIKIKQLTNEKGRVCSLLDTKCHEIKNNQKEIEKLKGEITNLEMKIKWNSVKLKQEIDSKLISEKKIEELAQEINQLKLNEIVKAREEIETEKAVINEKQLMEQQAALILMKHDNEEKERRIEILDKRLTSLLNDLKNSNAENAILSEENTSLKQELETQTQEISELHIMSDKQVMKIAELQSKLNDLETLRTQLAIEKEDNQRNKMELTEISSNYEEQEQEMLKLRTKENELLQFNKELSEAAVKLQNECSLLHSKALAISLENESIKKDKKYYDDIITNLENELTAERDQKQEERIITAKHITEKTKLAESTQKKLDFALGDLEAIKKKHSQSIKEMTRELNQLRKKAEQIENNTTKISEDRKKNEEMEMVQKTEVSSSQASDSDSQSTHNEFPNIQIQEPSKKALIDRIVRLQHAGARQSEKIDFLENHSANLVSELQKKSKLLHHYMLRDQTGALASSKSDRNKAELAKYGGIMAAVYNGAVKNNTSEMTLDLSLEINRKLQAVLEDTLLKNITLKENLDTLGLEVDKLTRQLALNAK